MSCIHALAFCPLNGLVPNPVFIILYLAQVHSTWPCHIYASPSEKINVLINYFNLVLILGGTFLAEVPFSYL